MSAASFFSSLFDAYPKGGDLRLEIRCLKSPDWERKNQIAQRWYVPESPYIENAAAWCTEMSAEWDVYFGVLPRMGHGGSQKDILLASCLFCDIDGGEEGAEGAISLLRASSLPTPNIAVVSGSGIHVYFLLSELVAIPEHSDREGYKRLLRRLCLSIGGKSPQAHSDTSACEVARILRVPGTWNHKREEPRPVKLIRHCPEERHSYDWWRGFLPPEPIEYDAREKKEAYTPAGFVSDGLLRWAEKGYPEGNRHNDLAGAAAFLVRDCGVKREDAAILLRMKANASPGRRPITDQEIEKILRWA